MCARGLRFEPGDGKAAGYLQLAAAAACDAKEQSEYGYARGGGGRGLRWDNDGRLSWYGDVVGRRREGTGCTETRLHDRL